MDNDGNGTTDWRRVALVVGMAVVLVTPPVATVLAVTSSPGSSNWPAYGHDFERTGRSLGAGHVVTPVVSANVSTDRVRSPPVIGDLDGNGTNEVVVVGYASGYRVTAVDVATERVEWRFEVEGVTGTLEVAPSIGDVDGDGGAEVVVGTETTLYALDGASGEAVWSAAPDGADFTAAAPAIADIDDDGTAEVVTSAGEYGLVAIDGRSGSVEWTDDVGEQQGRPAVADLDDDPELEVVFGNHSSFPSPSGIRVVDGATGDEEWSYTVDGRMAKPPSTALANVTGDGTTDVVFTYGGLGGGRMVVLDGERGTPAWDPREIEWSTTERRPPVLGDVDGDGDRDVVVASLADVTLYDGQSGTELWSISADRAIHSRSFAESGKPALANLDDDGALEVVVSDERADQVVAIDGNSGTVDWNLTGTELTEDDDFGGISTVPVVGDVDADGWNEVVFGGIALSPSKQLFAIEGANEPDQPPGSDTGGDGGQSPGSDTGGDGGSGVLVWIGLLVVVLIAVVVVVLRGR